MKKYVFVTATFLFGLVVGALAMNWLTIPARTAYREFLQRTYIYEEQTKGDKALREGQKLKALVHFWNQVDADPLRGTALFNEKYTKDLDKAFWFVLFPSMNRYIDSTLYYRPDSEGKAAGFAHARLAAILQRLGYEKDANQEWARSAALLQMPENEVRIRFINLTKKIEEGRL